MPFEVITTAHRKCPTAAVLNGKYNLRLSAKAADLLGRPSYIKMLRDSDDPAAWCICKAEEREPGAAKLHPSTLVFSCIELKRAAGDTHLLPVVLRNLPDWGPALALHL